MARFVLFLTIALAAFNATANAATISFTTDPFAGSTALTTPGRQVVAGELFTSFSIASDVFSFDPNVFSAGNTVMFANDIAANIPTSGVNIVVLRTFDDDADTMTPFAAGNAANLIAAQITAPGPGFFIYFNQGLDLPRLVYSTDLNDNTADLKILARLTNLTGQGGRDALPTVTASNFQFQAVPEPASLLLLSSAGVLYAGRKAAGRLRLSRRQRQDR